MNKIEICNVALGRIGQETIERIDEASETARQCNRFYDLTRKQVLRGFPWSFALRRVQLAQLTTSQKDFAYCYRYPSDALCVRAMYDESFEEDYRSNHYKIIGDAEGKVICTNIASAWMEYTADVQDTTVFDPQFVDAFAWKLASEIAYKLTGKLELMQNCIQAYNAFITDARTEDAHEDNYPEEESNRLADARF